MGGGGPEWYTDKYNIYISFPYFNTDTLLLRTIYFHHLALPIAFLCICGTLCQQAMIDLFTLRTDFKTILKIEELYSKYV